MECKLYLHYLTETDNNFFYFVNYQTGDTALHLAASGGHAEVVKVLLEAGSSATEENFVSLLQNFPL